MTELQYCVAFDLETTGVDVLNDRIVTASIVYLDPLDNVIENWEWIVNPGVDIPEGASNVHGVTNERAQAEGASPATSVYEIASILSYFLINKVPVIAYNASYDFSLLNAEIKRHLDRPTGFASFFENGEIPKYIVDPFVLDKKLDSRRPGSRTLTASAGLYGVSLENAHASYDDCVAAAQVLRSIWRKYPVLAECPDFPALYDQQIVWYHSQMTSLAAYFKRSGKKDADVNTVWPIREE